MTRGSFAARWCAFSLIVRAALLAPTDAPADDVRVAVAANFARPLERIAADFERDTGNHLVVSAGATGAFFAQIESGAPFDVFLAADEATPERLERDGYALKGTRFTYAVGALVLWSARALYVDPEGAVLKKGSFRHLAIANPRLAPYGAAAMETLASLGLVDAVGPRIVQGESIAQAYQFVATGSAELGFVALSQIITPGATPSGSFWIVPRRLHAPIAQDAVILRSGAASVPARSFCQYLEAPKARAVIESFGYEVGPARP